jgi:hypothetical protein
MLGAVLASKDREVAVVLRHEVIGVVLFGIDDFLQLDC